MGKRIGKFVTVFFDDSGTNARNISTDVDNIDGLPLSYDDIEVSGYGQNKNYLAGQGDSQITLDMWLTTTANTGTHTVFSGQAGVNTARTLTVQYGNNAAATTGDPEFEGEFIVVSYTVSAPKAGAQKCQAVLRVAADQALPAWGTVSA